LRRGKLAATKASGQGIFGYDIRQEKPPEFASLFSYLRARIRYGFDSIIITDGNGYGRISSISFLLSRI